MLLALGVDEWWEDHENLELADRSRASIIKEIAANQTELQVAADSYTSMRDTLAKFLSMPEDSITDFSFGVAIALLSSASWETATRLRSFHFLDYDWIIEVAQLHELQKLYTDAQSDFISAIGGLTPEQIDTDTHKTFGIIY